MYFTCSATCGGLGASEIERLKNLEHENSRLKPIYVDLSFEHDEPRSNSRLAIELHKSLPAERVIRVLDQMVTWRERPQVIRFENCAEPLADRFVS